MANRTIRRGRKRQDYMTGEDARTKDNKWSDDSVVIYDDGDVSFIWGKYEDSLRSTLGMRWNLSEGRYEPGYPHNGPHPRWLVLPDVIVWSSFLGLLTQVKQGIPKGQDIEKSEVWQKRILLAMSQWCH